MSRLRQPPDSRWTARLFAAAALVLVPWIAVLLRALPSNHIAAHWDITWGGFDTLLALILLAVAIASWQDSAWLEGAAAAAATLLVTDAWFDVLTSSTQSERAIALVEAAVIELPLAGFCLAIARNAKRRLGPLQPALSRRSVGPHLTR